MQVLVPTATLTARKYGVDRSITAESLFEPRLNIQLGTAYLRDQIDKFGRIEYVAAAYNAGPGRALPGALLCLWRLMSGLKRPFQGDPRLRTRRGAQSSPI